MAAENKKEIGFEIGHVLFIDIVGYSKLLINEQSEQIQTLREIVRGTEQFRLAETEGKLLRLPTGDGGALVFRNTPEAPVFCALEIAKELTSHPELRVRMGIHSGPVNEITDLNEQANIAGDGINLAQRVMDCGDAGHILISKRIVEDLGRYRHWQPRFHDLGECKVKHGLRLRIANLYTDEVGNRTRPKKLQIARRRKLDALAGAILCAGLLAATAIFLRHRADLRKLAAAIPEKSIAVLPFENLSEDKGNAYFAAGIQDEILTRLANLHELKVIARTSTEKYPSHPQNLATIAAELGVAHILEGSVQKIGNAVHMNVQLIKASNAAHVWAQSYDRNLEHAFAVQGEVAQTVANALKVALAPAEIDRLNSLPTQNPAAYDSFLKGEYALDQAQKNPGDYQKTFEPAIVSFQKAVVADPGFALAYARLAEAELTKHYCAHLDGRVAQIPELLLSAKQNIDRALQLDPDLPSAHAALGHWHAESKHGREAAIPEYRRALELDPRLAIATVYLAGTTIGQGHPEESIHLLSNALQFDPRNYQLLRSLSQAHLMRREYQQAAEVDSQIMAIDPSDEVDAANLCLDTIFINGDLDAARHVLDSLYSHLPANHQQSSVISGTELLLLTLRRDFAAAKNYAESLSPDNWPADWSKPQMLGNLERFGGNTEAARAYYQTARVLLTAAVVKNSEEAQSHADLALVDAALGLNDEALREAQRAIELEPPEKNAWVGLDRLYNLAIVNTRLGRIDDAIKGIEQLLAMPNAGAALPPWILKLDPEWDPLRGDRRFEKIVASLKPK